MRRPPLAIVLALAPGPAFAHDAFGDLGPFYANLLHPLADPMQAALIIGTAAFFAGRSLDTVRLALPVFVVAAALSHLLLRWSFGMVPPPLLPALAAVVVGVAATLPDRRAWIAAGLGLIAAVGALVGLAPDRPAADGAMQPILGTIIGIAVLVTLAWAALDVVTRRISRLTPAVAGSWVAAVGLLAGAFALQPAGSGTARDGVALQAPSFETSNK